MPYFQSSAKSNIYTLCNINDIDLYPYRIAYTYVHKWFGKDNNNYLHRSYTFVQNTISTDWPNATNGTVDVDEHCTHTHLWIIPRESEKDMLEKMNTLIKLASESNNELKIKFVYDDEFYRTLFPDKNILIGYDDRVTLLLRERALPHGVQCEQGERNAQERVIHFPKGLTWILNEIMNKLASVCPDVALKQTDKYKFIREYLTYTDDNHTLPMQYFWIRPDKLDESNQLHNEMQERYETNEKNKLFQSFQTLLDKIRYRLYEIDVFYQFEEKIRPFPTSCTQLPSIRALFDEILNYCSSESDTIFIGWPALSPYLTKSNKSWNTDYTNYIPLFDSENDNDNHHATQFLEPIKRIIHTLE